MRQILLLAGFISSFTGFSQVYFSTPVDIGSTTTLQGYRPRIALVNDTTPMVAWPKQGTGTGLYTSRWVYTPAYFSTPAQIFPPGSSFVASVTEGPELITRNDTVYVTIWGTTAGQKYIYLCRSFNGGATFADTQVVYRSNKRLVYPSIAFLNNHKLGLAFMRSEADESLPEILFTQSADRGLTWSAPVNISTVNPGVPCECCPLNLSASGNDVVISYRNNISNIRDFYAAHSLDNGSSFTHGFPIDTSAFFTNTCPLSGTDGFIAGDTLYSVFTTKVGSLYQVKYARTHIASGANRNDFISPAGVSQNHPCIAGNGDTLGIVFQQTASAQDVFFTYKIPSAPWSTPVNISNGTSSQHLPDVAFKNGVFHIVYFDQLATQNKPRYIRAAFNPVTLAVAEHETAPDDILVYPNPFTNMLTIESAADITMLDAGGKIIARGNAAQVQQIMVQQPKGIYYMLANGKTQKLVKM